MLQTFECFAGFHSRIEHWTWRLRRWASSRSLSVFWDIITIAWCLFGISSHCHMNPESARGRSALWWGTFRTSRNPLRKWHLFGLELSMKQHGGLWWCPSILNLHLQISIWLTTNSICRLSHISAQRWQPLTTSWLCLSECAPSCFGPVIDLW
jgi:hypothetical protein